MLIFLYDGRLGLKASFHFFVECSLTRRPWLLLRAVFCSKLGKRRMLTAKQEKFCQGVAKGLNYSDAYREAYNASKMKPETVNRTAAELMGNRKITARIDELRAETTEEIKYTVEDSFRKLSEIQALAMKNKKLSDAIKAEELKGKLKGLYVEKREISGGLDLTPFKIDVVE